MSRHCCHRRHAKTCPNRASSIVILYDKVSHTESVLDQPMPFKDVIHQEGVKIGHGGNGNSEISTLQDSNSGTVPVAGEVFNLQNEAINMFFKYKATIFIGWNDIASFFIHIFLKLTYSDGTSVKVMMGNVIFGSGTMRYENLSSTPALGPATPLPFDSSSFISVAWDGRENPFQLLVPPGGVVTLSYSIEDISGDYQVNFVSGVLSATDF